MPGKQNDWITGGDRAVNIGRAKSITFMPAEERTDQQPLLRIHNRGEDYPVEVGGADAAKIWRIFKDGTSLEGRERELLAFFIDYGRRNRVLIEQKVIELSAEESEDEDDKDYLALMEHLLRASEL